jgi:hypothetical protein
MHRSTVSLALTLALPCLAACSDRSEIETGYYEAYDLQGHSEDRSQILATTLNIDRDADTATFTLDDGTEITTSWTTAKRDDWPTGCPTNYSNTQMEVLFLDESPLVIASLELTDPVLIAGCPANSTDVVLTEDDGSILGQGYGGVPCDGGSDVCLWFSLVED